MRVVGRNKDEDILLSQLHIDHLERFYVCGFHKANTDGSLYEFIAAHCERDFGGIPIRIMDRDEKEMAEFPDETIYAHLTSPSLHFGKELILVWFQKTNQDPFSELKKYLENINWNREAKDFEF